MKTLLTPALGLQLMAVSYAQTSDPACWSIEGTFSAAQSRQLGVSVALSGNTLVVANELASSGALAFVKGGDSWALQQELLPSTPVGSIEDSHYVDLDGDLAVMTYAAGVGAAYVFHRTGSTWTEEDTLIPSNPVANGHFGKSVAIDGQRIAVGAPDSDTVYIFERQGTDWVQTQAISDSSSFNFGADIALDGDSLAINAGTTPTIPAPIQEVRVYVHNGASWVLEQAIPSPSPSIGFPTSLAISGDRLAVGAMGVNDPDADAAYIYTRSASEWTLETTLIPSPPIAAFYRFGLAIDLDSTKLAVGGIDYGPGQPYPPGQIFLYTLSEGTWIPEASLAPPPGPVVSGVHEFGATLDLDGPTIVAGDAHWQTSFFLRGGVAWVFESDPSNAPTVGYRNAGANPVSYSAGEVRLGETLHLTVAPAMTGHSQALVFGYDSPVSLQLASGQVLLCFDFGSGLLLNTGFLPGPFAAFEVSVPFDVGLLGLQVCTQAVHAFGTPGFALSNAQDLRVGPPTAACP